MGLASKLKGLGISVELIHALLLEPSLSIEAILVPLLVVCALFLGHLLLVVGNIVMGLASELE